VTPEPGAPAVAGAGADAAPGARSRRGSGDDLARRQRRRAFREKVRVTVRGIGEVFITAGFVLLLFCGYQLIWTDVLSARESDKLLNTFEQQVAAAPVVDGKIPDLELEDGKVFAAMYVPRFGQSWVRPILQGTDLGDLHKGVGHYEQSAKPGELGNFAIAGHRTTNGHPFRNIDDLEPGDQIFVETKYAWYTYEVETPRLIVDPTDVYVVQPVPEEGAALATPTRKLLTMTSCNPPYSARERIIVHAVQTDVRPRSAGPPPGAPKAATA
jgi:sortase A